MSIKYDGVEIPNFITITNIKTQVLPNIENKLLQAPRAIGAIDVGTNYGTKVNGVLWDNINHVNDELLWYESNFNELMSYKEFEDNGQIHVNPRLCIDLNSSADIDFPDYIENDNNLELYNEKCCCTKCLIKYLSR